MVQEELYSFEAELGDDVVNLRAELADIKADYQVQRDHRTLVGEVLQQQQQNWVHGLD